MRARSAIKNPAPASTVSMHTEYSISNCGESAVKLPRARNIGISVVFGAELINSLKPNNGVDLQDGVQLVRDLRRWCK